MLTFREKYTNFAGKLLTIMQNIKELSTLEWAIIGVIIFMAGIFLLAILLPPPGVVDESVRECLWIMLAADGILAVVFGVHKGVDAKYQHGNTSIELTQKKQQ